MPARVAVTWLNERIHAAWTGESDDLEDWLAGNDAVLAERVNKRRIDTILEAGGEIG